MTSATITPMDSEDGASPPTNENRPLAPTCSPSVPFWALTASRIVSTLAVSTSPNSCPANVTVA